MAENQACVDSPKYRAFSSAVEKALKSFEYTSEWADLISTLDKLKKVLQSGQNFRVVPKNVTLAKRLAQCLHHVLPFGVHLKAIETYKLIFNTIGTEGLSKELFLYSFGLFPLFSNATITVKRSLLDLYDEYFVPLKENLRPGLTGFLTGILPGLEEEGTEFYDKTNNLLLRVQQGVGAEYFFDSLWDCVLLSATVRLSAFRYVLSQFDKRKSVDDQLFMMGLNITKMVSALHAASSDQNVLVQRHLLDLLSNFFPLHASSLSDSDNEQLIQGVLFAVLKRDMSLNRRVYGYLLGQNVVPGERIDLHYYDAHTKRIVVRSIRSLLREVGGEEEKVMQIIRLHLYLLDRPEIGNQLLNSILLQLLLCCRNIVKNIGDGSRKQISEVEKSLNMLFNALEPGYLWCYLAQCFDNKRLLEFCCDRFAGIISVEGLAERNNNLRMSKSNAELLLQCGGSTDSPFAVLMDLIIFSLASVSLDSHRDIRTYHLPKLLLQLQKFGETNVHLMNELEITKLLNVSQHLLDSINDVGGVVTTTTDLAKEIRDKRDSQREEADVSLNTNSPSAAEEKSLGVTSETSEMQYVLAADTRQLVHKALQAFLLVVEKILSRMLDSGHSSAAECVQNTCTVLQSFVDFPFYCTPDEGKNALRLVPDDSFPQWLFCLMSGCRSPNLSMVDSCLTVLLHLMFVTDSLCAQWDSMKSSTDTNSGASVPLLMIPLLSQKTLNKLEKSEDFFMEVGCLLWSHMDPAFSNDTQKAVELFCFLHRSDLHETSSVCEDIVVKELASCDQELCVSALRKFSVLWSVLRTNAIEKQWYGSSYKGFDRSLLFIVKNLLSSKLETVADHVRIWLASCLKQGDLPRLIQPVVLQILHPSTARVALNRLSVGTVFCGDFNVFLMNSNVSTSLVHVATRKCVPVEVEEDLNCLLCSDSTVTRVATEIVDDSSMENSQTDTDDSDKEELHVVRSVLAQLIDQVVYDVDYDDVLVAGVGDDNVSLQSPLKSARTPSPDSCSEVDSTNDPYSPPQTSFDEYKSPSHTGLTPAVQAAHHHMCLYVRRNVDFQLLRSSFDALAALLMICNIFPFPVHPRHFLFAAASSITSDGYHGHSHKILELLQRHHRCLRSDSFFEEFPPETHKSVTYLELMLGSALHTLRSFVTNGPMASASLVTDNNLLKLSCLGFLIAVIQELAQLVTESGKQFAFYVNDVLSKERSKVQITTLHLMAVSLQELRIVTEPLAANLSTQILQFNWPDRDTVISYQSQLIRLCELLIRLEFAIKTAKADVNRSGIRVEKLSVSRSTGSPVHSLKFQPIVDDHLFMKTVLNALRCNFDTLELWVSLIISSLPYMETQMGTLLLHICDQLCRNIDMCCPLYRYKKETKLKILLPVDYLTLCLSTLGAICQFTMTDSPVGHDNFPGFGSGSGERSAAGEILGNLFKVFTWGDNLPVESPSTSKIEKTSNPHFVVARQELLGALPQTLSTVVHLWSSIKNNSQPQIPIGLPQNVRRQILELLAPLAMNNSRHFLSALALVWMNRIEHPTKKTSAKPTLSECQKDIVDMLLSLRVFQPENLLLALSATIKDPITVSNAELKASCPLEIFLLEMLYGCLSTSPVTFKTCAAALSSFIIEGLQSSLSAKGLFFLFIIFCEFLSNGYVRNDRPVVKGLQDLCSKLVDAISGIIAWQLEQTTWLKRTLVVKSELNSSEAMNGGENVEMSVTKKRSELELTFSTQALFLFAELLVPLIDILYKSEDKDRLQVLLSSVWHNISPYLKAKSLKNAQNFEAASKLLASLSHFPYTRTVWKRAAMEMLVEPNFFQMDKTSLLHWFTIVDNLMTHDKTTFKDLMGRIAISQGPSLFSNKDQEYELRSNMLKRLAFTVLSSERDQYQGQMPEIQERLTENLRLYHVPHVHAQVFLCFRVLIFRLSYPHLTSMWPTVMTELIQVLSQIEQELTGEDISDDYKCARDDQWLQLYLSACKLLETLLLLPPELIPQFQMYRWAFVSSNDVKNEATVKKSESVHAYLSHSLRITKAFPVKGKENSAVVLDKNRTTMSIKSLKHVKELQGFFSALSHPKLLVKLSDGLSSDKIIGRLEKSFEIDFVERMS